MRFIWLLFSASIILIGSCDAKKVALSAAVSAALCGQWDFYKESKEIQPSMATVPANIPLPKCGDFVWNRCASGEKGCGDVIYEPPAAGACKAQRVIGGVQADNAEFPWDVSIRFIYDWGKFWPEPRKTEDIITNDFEGLKESHRCTGTLYSKSWVITSAWCALRGKDYIQTKSRFVMWIARGEFLDAKQIEYLPGQQKKGDIEIHPDFFPDPDTDHTKDHDIALIKVPKPFQFGEKIYALEVAPPSKVFTGRATFTGWGTTDQDLINTMLSRPKQKAGFGTKLFKLELNILPFEGECETLVRDYLKTQKNYDEKTPLKDQYLCAQADNPDAQGSCGGDLGGPLICDDNGKKYLCGIKNSWAIVTSCPTPDNMEVFIRPSYYLTWMQKVAGKQVPGELVPPPPPKPAKKG